MPVKPSDKEQEYFVRHEAERLRKLTEEHRKEMQAEEREKQRALHFMKCPKCGMDLQEIAFAGVKVDKCFGCEGLWLDNRELEEIQKRESGFGRRFAALLRP